MVLSDLGIRIILTPSTLQIDAAFLTSLSSVCVSGADSKKASCLEAVSGFVGALTQRSSFIIHQSSSKCFPGVRRVLTFCTDMSQEFLTGGGDRGSEALFARVHSVRPGLSTPQQVAVPIHMDIFSPCWTRA